MYKTKDQIIAREQKELTKWKAMREKSVPKHYTVIMVVVISIIYLLDSLATDLHTGLSELEMSYFSNVIGISYEQVMAIFSMVSIISILLNILSPFYKALADRLGRKKLFVISTFGMGIGLFMGYLSTNLVMYVLGRTILQFFIIADIQVIYIMEVADPAKRAKLFSVTKCISNLGILIIPLCRDLLLDASGSNWRDICLVPSIIAIVCTALVALFIQESNVFLDNRIAYLERPYEERQEEKERLKQQKQVDTNRGGVGMAFKYVKSEKQLRNIVITYAIFLLGMYSFIGYYNTICMKQGMDTAAITLSLYTYPVASALITLIAGFISDKFGRKNLSVAYVFVCFAAMLGYVFLAGTISPLVIGIFYGIVHGSYWTIGDAIQMMLSESTKTEMRSSTMAVNGLVSLVAATVSALLYGVLVLIVDISILCIIGGVITMGLMSLLLLKGIRETKGTVFV